MGGQITIRLFSLLIIVYFAEAVPKIPSKNGNNLNFNSGSSEKTRGLAVGDTFTPQELLKVARSIFGKVHGEVEGRGRGIVSSSKNPYELADRLYEAFFLTLKRIVVLRVDDIGGLDALQALSLSGDVVDKSKNPLDSYTESPLSQVNLKGNYVEVFPRIPRICHYKVLTKGIERKSKTRSSTRFRRKLGNKKMALRTSNSRPAPKTGKKKSASKAGKNKLQQKHGKIRDQKSPVSIKNDVRGHGRMGNRTTGKLQNKSEISEPICRWRYGCAIPIDLHTCRLHSVCGDNGTNVYVKEEQSENMRRFRKMVGMHIIDEEVEKIVEAHILLMKKEPRNKPQNLNSNSDNFDKKIESLAEYFNQMMAFGHTTPLPSDSKDDIHGSGKFAHSKEFFSDGSQGLISKAKNTTQKINLKLLRLKTRMSLRM